MLPCFICGIDASTGWIQGFVPAPDSQKLALCSEHDNPANRQAVAEAWDALLRKDIAGHNEVNRLKARPLLQTVTVRFMAGGMLSFLCTSCSPTEQATLKIEQPDGNRTFIPLRQIREYTVRPNLAGEYDESVLTAASLKADVHPPSQPAEGDDQAKTIPVGQDDPPQAIDAPPEQKTTAASIEQAALALRDKIVGMRKPRS